MSKPTIEEIADEIEHRVGWERCSDRDIALGAAKKIIKLFEDEDAPEWERRFDKEILVVGFHECECGKCISGTSAEVIKQFIDDELKALVNEIEEIPDRHANDLKEMCDIRKAFRKRGV